MKDPKRIDKIIELLRATWKSTPHERLGQLLVNATGLDSLFYIEDEDLVACLRPHVSRPQTNH